MFERAGEAGKVEHLRGAFLERARQFGRELAAAQQEKPALAPDIFSSAAGTDQLPHGALRRAVVTVGIIYKKHGIACEKALCKHKVRADDIAYPPERRRFHLYKRYRQIAGYPVPPQIADIAQRKPRRRAWRLFIKDRREHARTDLIGAQRAFLPAAAAGDTDIHFAFPFCFAAGQQEARPAAIRAECTENAVRRFEGCGFGADRYPRDTLRGEGIAERKAIRPAHKAAFGKGILQGDGKRERGRAIPP